MLLDTGADVSLLPLDVADLLEIEIPDDAPESSLGGIGGSVPVRFGEIEVILGDVTLSIRVAWGPKGCPALLGERDVFDRFDVTYSKSRGWVRLFEAGETES